MYVKVIVIISNTYPARKDQKQFSFNTFLFQIDFFDIDMVYLFCTYLFKKGNLVTNQPGKTGMETYHIVADIFVEPGLTWTNPTRPALTAPGRQSITT